MAETPGASNGVLGLSVYNPSHMRDLACNVGGEGYSGCVRWRDIMQNIKAEWIATKSKDVKWLEINKSKPYESFTITSVKTPAHPAVGL